MGGQTSTDWSSVWPVSRNRTFADHKPIASSFLQRTLGYHYYCIGYFLTLPSSGKLDPISESNDLLTKPDGRVIYVSSNINGYTIEKERDAGAFGVTITITV